MYNLKRRVQVSGQNTCFLKCPGCYNYFGSSDYLTSDLLKFLNELKRETDLEFVTLTGGDPLARSDILFIVNSLNKIGYKLRIDTVGLSFVRDRANFAGKIIKRVNAKNMVNLIDNIGIPLDGSSDEIISKFRPGLLLHDITEVFTELEKANINVQVNTVVHKMNYKDIPNIYPIIRKHKNIYSWKLYEFMPIGPGGSKFRERFAIKHNDFIQVGCQLLSLNKEKFRVCVKSGESRGNNYLLVDGEGNIWIPEVDNNLFGLNSISDNGRTIFGNICDENIVAKLIYQLKLIDK